MKINDLLDAITVIGLSLITAIITKLIIETIKSKKRQHREELLQQDQCNIGCKNCNAQQCPNNPNYIRKIMN